MGTKELLLELNEYLKAKYSATGFATADQVDGCMSSGLCFVLSSGQATKEFKIVLAETQKKFD